MSYIDGVWKLQNLPAKVNPIWRDKYKVPWMGDSFMKDKGPGYKEAFLRSLGLRPPHQAHFRISMDEKRAIRISLLQHFSGRVDLNWDTLDAMQFSMDPRFREKRNLLDSQGYIVLDDFIGREVCLGSSNTREEEPSWKTMLAEVQQMFSFFQHDAPAPGCYTDYKQKCYSRIRNTDELPHDVDEDDSRWTTTPYCMNTRLETLANIHILKARCNVEISIWTLVHWLHLEAESLEDIPDRVPDDSDSTPMPPLSATDSGCKVLGTSENCSPQVAYKDYRHPEPMPGTKYPD